MRSRTPPSDSSDDPPDGVSGWPGAVGWPSLGVTVSSTGGGRPADGCPAPLEKAAYQSKRQRAVLTAVVTGLAVVRPYELASWVPDTAAGSGAFVRQARSLIMRACFFGCLTTIRVVAWLMAVAT
jgi:hypothetical protein